ncbi:MAG: class I SAM-dependent DNA methyltransferase, partial [Acetobacteraceae bacterium]|nr:class I SAM-dependent DNA methyltransferase [Acetobacteraceae bacterium]
AAYGWPQGLPDAEIVARVVALNAERMAEEADGTVRWLRPEFQAPDEARRRAAAVQIGMPVAEPAPAATSADAWPKEAPAQFIVLRAALSRGGPASAKEIARRFRDAPRGPKLAGMLETLAALGQARALEGGRYTA